MKITQDVRDYAATLNDPDKRAIAGADGLTAQDGMDAMSEKFNAMGEQVYVDAEDTVKESNKALS